MVLLKQKWRTGGEKGAVGSRIVLFVCNKAFLHSSLHWVINQSTLMVISLNHCSIRPGSGSCWSTLDGILPLSGSVTCGLALVFAPLRPEGTSTACWYLTAVFSIHLDILIFCPQADKRLQKVIQPKDQRFSSVQIHWTCFGQTIKFWWFFYSVRFLINKKGKIK